MIVNPHGLITSAQYEETIIRLIGHHRIAASPYFLADRIRIKGTEKYSFRIDQDKILVLIF